MIKILVVCWGNVFRSPVVEYLINEKLVELGLEGKIECTSRGIQGQGEIPAPKFKRFPQYLNEYSLAEPVLNRHGINIDKHDATPIDLGSLNTYDLILPLDEKVTTHLVSILPEIKEKILIHSDSENKSAIEDPATSLNNNKYEKIVPEIIALVEMLMPRLIQLTEGLEPNRELKSEMRRNHERQ